MRHGRMEPARLGYVGWPHGTDGVGMENSIQRRLADDGTTTITVCGDIDFGNYEQLAGCIADALAEWSPSVVHVDLGAAAFIDTTGIGALIEGYKAATDAGAEFVVVDPTRAFRRVLDVTG